MTIQTQSTRFYELSELARQHGDMAAVRAFDKAAVQWERGTRPLESAGTFLIESRTSPGNVYRVRREGGVLGCNCGAGLSGRQCWHVCLVAALDTGEDFIPQRTPEPSAPTCCGAPMQRDTASWYCRSCKHWFFID
jgi:hypothetical protein